MPPRKRKAAPTTVPPVLLTAGAGITTGLELWLHNGTTFVLHDRTPDGRFASDVITWNTTSSLNATDLQAFKDAANTSRSR